MHRPHNTCLFFQSNECNHSLKKEARILIRKTFRTELNLNKEKDRDNQHLPKESELNLPKRRKQKRGMVNISLKQGLLHLATVIFKRPYLGV